MEKPIDLLEHLARIVRENTLHYRSDFSYDERTLRQAAAAQDAADRIFYWMSRPNGTWCVREREVFIRGSGAHTIWTHYADEPEQISGIKAYRIAVTGIEDGKVMGTLRALNYAEQVRRVLAHSVPVTAITLTYESGCVNTFPIERQYQSAIPIVRPKDGGIREARYEVADEAELKRVIAAENREQMKRPGKKHSRRRER